MMQRIIQGHYLDSDFNLNPHTRGVYVSLSNGVEGVSAPFIIQPIEIESYFLRVAFIFFLTFLYKMYRI